MKRFGVLLLGLSLLGAAGCGDDTAPSNLPIVMTATLLPSNEVPAIASPENTGHGAVQITFNVTRDGTGAITGGTADFHFQLAGYPSSTTIVAAHIHPGAAGVNGGVIINTGIVAASPVTPTDGVMSFSVANVAVSAALLQNIVNNPAAFYFNVHSPLNPGGVSRGQLNRTQ
jgi:CHRD domain